MAEYIKKVIIPKSSLPAIGAVTGSYKVRYRIVSDDLNRTSHWSPIHKLSVTPISNTVPYDIQVGENTITTIWNAIAGLPISSFDVYLRWMADPVSGEDIEEKYPWEYATTIGTTSYSLIKPTSIVVDGISVVPTRFQISVQVFAYNKQRNAEAALFTSEITSL